MKVCSNCNIAVMTPHPELFFWVKCSICGFCSLEMSELTIKNQELAKQNPMCLTPEAYTKKIKKDQ